MPGELVTRAFAAPADPLTPLADALGALPHLLAARAGLPCETLRVLATSGRDGDARQSNQGDEDPSHSAAAVRPRRAG